LTCNQCLLFGTFKVSVCSVAASGAIDTRLNRSRAIHTRLNRTRGTGDKSQSSFALYLIITPSSRPHGKPSPPYPPPADMSQNKQALGRRTTSLEGLWRVSSKVPVCLSLSLSLSPCASCLSLFVYLPSVSCYLHLPSCLSLRLCLCLCLCLSVSVAVAVYVYV